MDLGSMHHQLTLPLVFQQTFPAHSDAPTARLNLSAAIPRGEGDQPVSHLSLIFLNLQDMKSTLRLAVADNPSLGIPW